jgi:hypothetical protein
MLGAIPMKVDKAVRRFDLGELREVTRTPQGFLMCPGFTTRAGVFVYMDGTGKVRRELRHPDDVFDPISLATMRDNPVTVEHPPVMLDPGNVDKYRKGHTTGRVEVNRDLVETDFIIESQEAIDYVERDGVREVSSGYVCDIVEEAGVYNGTGYDYRQKNIVYNHQALVRRGRAGPEVRLRLDSADAVMQDPPRAIISQEAAMDVDPTMAMKTKKVVISGQEVDLPSGIADVVQDMMDRYDEIRAKYLKLEESMSKQAGTVRRDADISQPGISPQVPVVQGAPDGRSAPAKVGAADTSGPAKAKGDGEVEKEKTDAEKEQEKKDAEAAEKEKKDVELAAMKKDLEESKKDLEESKKKMDSLQEKVDAYANASFGKGEKKDRQDAADAEQRKAEMRARITLERTAEKLVPFEVAKKFDSMSDDEIRSAVIKHRNPALDLKGKSSVYLEARFDSLVEELGDDSESRKTAGRAFLGAGEKRLDSKEDSDPEAARRKMTADSTALWQAPLSANKKTQ